MSKREFKYRTRYRRPGRHGIKIRAVGDWKWFPARRPMWLRVLAAAAAILLIGFSLVFAGTNDFKQTHVPVMGALSWRAVGTWSIGGGFTAVPTIAIPAGTTATDLMVACAVWKQYDVTADITDWTEVTEFSDGTVAQGASVGSMKVAAWTKEHDGSEADPTITWGGAPNIAGGVMISFQKSGLDTWNAAAFATAAIASATNWVATAGSDPGIAGGDALVGLVGFPDDTAQMDRDVDAGLDCDGITWAADYQEAPATHGSTSSNNDCAADLGYRIAASGTSSAPPTMAGTIALAKTGAALFIRLRVTAGTSILPLIDGGQDNMDDMNGMRG